jgi:hypothetical protein
LSCQAIYLGFVCLRGCPGGQTFRTFLNVQLCGKTINRLEHCCIDITVIWLEAFLEGIADIIVFMFNAAAAASSV